MNEYVVKNSTPVTNCHSTKDFYHAVILRISGFKLIELQKQKGNFVTFVFSDPDHKAEQTITEHWNRELKVVSRDLIEAINELKTRLYSKQ